MKNGTMPARAINSVRGLRACWQRERSFRTHLILSALSVTALALAQVPLLWWPGLLLALATGIAMELMNAALEACLDHLHPGLHPQIGAAKDMASAAAFVINGMAAGLFVAAMATRLPG